MVKKLIGYSYSRCLLDVVEGRVKFEDIHRIEARTKFDVNKPEQWKSIWRGYTTPNMWSDWIWAPHKDKEALFFELTKRLFDEGRIQQDRLQGGWPPRVNDNDIWAEIHLEDNE